jgi:hypothetical protein
MGKLSSQLYPVLAFAVPVVEFRLSIGLFPRIILFFAVHRHCFLPRISCHNLGPYSGFDIEQNIPNLS